MKSFLSLLLLFTFIPNKVSGQSGVLGQDSLSGNKEHRNQEEINLYWGEYGSGEISFEEFRKLYEYGYSFEGRDEFGIIYQVDSFAFIIDVDEEEPLYFGYKGNRLTAMAVDRLRMLDAGKAVRVIVTNVVYGGIPWDRREGLVLRVKGND